MRLWVFAFVGPLVLALAVIVFGALTPGYSQVSNWISDLAADGAPYGVWMSVFGIGAFSLCLVATGIAGLRARFAETRVRAAFALLLVAGTGILAAAVFPCDAGCPVEGGSAKQIAHNAGAGLGFLALLVAQGLVAAGLRAERTRHALVSAATAAGSLVFLVAMQAGIEGPYRGLFQKSFVFCVCVFLIATGLALRARELGRRAGASPRAA